MNNVEVGIICTTIGAVSSDSKSDSEVENFSGKILPNDVAKRIAQTLVKEKLAFCINVSSRVDSFFWYEGAFDDSGADGEVIMQIKTLKSLIPATMGRLEELHPYDVPMIWVVNIEEINDSAAGWINEVFELV